MQDPEPPGGTGERLSPEERRRRVRRAAFLRPINLLMAVIGGIAFALTLSWWVLPLTLATYAALVFLAARDPFFQGQVLGERPATRLRTLQNRRASPERRVRWLPRGETRRKAEEALEIHRRTVFAIEESGDAARAVLDDAVPKLQRVVERLMDIAEERERTAGAIRELENTSPISPPSNPDHSEGQTTDLTRLEKELHAADAEISTTLEKLSTLRARVVRLSLESEEAAQGAAARLNADLDELNLRLDALSSTTSPE